MCQSLWQRGSLLVGLRQFSTLRKKVTCRRPSSFGHAIPLQKTKIPKQAAPQIWCSTKFSFHRLRTVGSIALYSSLPLCSPLQSFGTARPSLKVKPPRSRPRAPFEEPSRDPSMAYSVRAKCSTGELKSRSEQAVEFSLVYVRLRIAAYSLLEPFAAPTVSGDVVSCGHVPQETRGSASPSVVQFIEQRTRSSERGVTWFPLGTAVGQVVRREVADQAPFGMLNWFPCTAPHANSSRTTSGNCASITLLSRTEKIKRIRPNKP